MIRNALQRFMYGRYGKDQLNSALLVFSLTFYGLYFLTRFELCYWVSFVSIAFGLYRALSRNPVRRRAENAKFLQMAGPAIQWLRMRRDKEHRYFKCPNCGHQLRVPRGKGRILVTCRNCGAMFEEKS